MKMNLISCEHLFIYLFIDRYRLRCRVRNILRISEHAKVDNLKKKKEEVKKNFSDVY